MTVSTLSTGQREIAREDRGGSWLLYTLLFIAALCLPLSIRASGWVPEPDRLIYVTIWSLLAGIVLARSSSPNWLAWVISLALGVTYSLQFAGQLLPTLGALVQDIGGSIAWLWHLALYHEMPGVFPLSNSFGHIVSQAEIAMSEINIWLAATRSGVGSEDVTVLWLLVSFSIWIITWYAVYELLRTKRALIALLPLGTAIVSNAAITYIGNGYVQTYVAMLLIILVQTNVDRMQRVWQRLGVDFSSELHRDTMIAGVVIAIAILVVSLAIPYVTYNRAVFYFWDRYGPTLEQFYDELDRAFAGRNPVPDPPPGRQQELALGILPHDVGLGSDLSDRVVLMVSISDPPPPPPDVVEELAAAEGLDPRRLVERRYWRQRTYDEYTGSGWDTSERNIVEIVAEEPWIDIDYPHTVVTQTFTLIDTRSNIAYGINQPVLVEAPYRVILRGQDDLVGLSLDVDEYTVVSYVSDPTREDLRAAESAYPDEIAERYLDLPEDVPQRVQDLARDIVTEAGVETRYDIARAIETYIRRYEYDLDLEPPPLDTDITDYFLFDAQRGYCDYSASAMVVMLRSLGVASRYASGYAMGQYNYVQEQWVVTGENAHAWAEVYFPGLGWIEFEPTPTELPREFVGEPEPFDFPDRPLPSVDESAPGLPVGWIAGGVLGLVLAFVIIWPPKYLSQRSSDPRDLVRHAYERLVRRTRWLKLEPQDGQTPQEYLRYLADQVERRGSFAGAAADDIEIIGRMYQKARYSPDSLGQEEGDRVQGAWRRLRGRFFRLLFTRMPDDATLS